jgi:unsaturated rhamnogalacturonyl hydrolase
MKNLLAGCIFLFFSLSSFSQASNTWSVKFSDAIVSRYTPTINAMTGKGWEYSNTIILHGMEKVYNCVNNASYLNYIKGFIDTYLNADGTFTGAVSLVSLDRVHPGISCLFLYEKLKSNLADSLKYRTAATNLRNVLVGASATYSPYRTPVKKIFWHKQTGYDNIMMLDGMYMAHPFLAKYGKLFGDNAAMDTAVNQVLFAYNQLYVSGTHLIKHAWKEPGSSGTVSWDDVAGNSTSVWSRAMGWYMMALVDILKYVPPAHPRRGELLTALSNLAIGIKNYQDPSSHLWYQVVDKTSATLSGNYLETSGSAMFVYALKTASDSGWINSATYLPVAQSGWTGLQSKINNYTDGKPRINDFAPAMSVQNTEALYVQASLQPVDCPVATGTQHPHGYAAILMAASVMEFPLSILPVRFISFTAKEYADKIQLTWQNGDESEVDHYEIQKSVNGSDFTVIGNARAAGLPVNNFDDKAVNSKTVYYRINAISQNGSAHYSAIIAVRKNSKAFEMKISPNPVQDGVVNILLSNVKQGRYSLKVINSAGNVIAAKSIDISDEGNIIQTILLPPGSSKGLYYVQLDGNAVLVNKSAVVK